MAQLIAPTKAVRFDYVGDGKNKRAKFHLLADPTDALIGLGQMEVAGTVCGKIIWGYQGEYYTDMLGNERYKNVSSIGKRLEIVDIADLPPDQLCGKCCKAFAVKE